LCQVTFRIGIEHHILNNPSSYIHIPHIHLHGSPLHAMICYINLQLKVRNVGETQFRGLQVAEIEYIFQKE